LLLSRRCRIESRRIGSSADHVPALVLIPLAAALACAAVILTLLRHPAWVPVDRVVRGQGRFVDSQVGREACARPCIARKAEIQALITFDFWLSDLDQCDARWRGFLASLQLGQWIADPKRGPSLS